MKQAKTPNELARLGLTSCVFATVIEEFPLYSCCTLSMGIGMNILDADLRPTYAEQTKPVESAS